MGMGGNGNRNSPSRTPLVLSSFASMQNISATVSVLQGLPVETRLLLKNCSFLCLFKGCI